MPAKPCSPRIAVFTHDTFGLGHVRRSMHIIGALAERAPRAAILFITGSPALHTFKALPPNADYVKIPTVVKTGSRGAQPPHLPVPLAEVSLLRERLIEETMRTFAPDVFLVDNFPLGTQRDLLAGLHEVRRRSGRAILGLRDIVDAPEVVRADWERQGIYEILDRYYDRILVYGMREVLDVADTYGLPPRIAAKVHYCGYVTAEISAPRPPADVRAELGIAGPLIMAAAGGGGDGFPLLEAFVQALPLVPATSAVVFTGPLMSSSERAELRAQVADRPGVVIRDHVEDLTDYFAAADVVVTMCGYNTAVEVVALQTRAIVVPRTWRYGEHVKRAQASMEWEQILRAQALARLGLIDLLEPESLAPERLAERIAAALAHPKATPTSSIGMHGLQSAANHILAMAYGEEGIADVQA